MSSEAQIPTAATPLGSRPPRGKSWSRRPRWTAALALLTLVIGVGATVGIHAAQGVGNRQRAQLAAARELASKVVGRRGQRGSTPARWSCPCDRANCRAGRRLRSACWRAEET